MNIYPLSVIFIDPYWFDPVLYGAVVRDVNIADPEVGIV
jgi:hypothetical protein